MARMRRNEAIILRLIPSLSETAARAKLSVYVVRSIVRLLMRSAVPIHPRGQAMRSRGRVPFDLQYQADFAAVLLSISGRGAHYQRDRRPPLPGRGAARRAQPW